LRKESLKLRYRMEARAKEMDGFREKRVYEIEIYRMETRAKEIAGFREKRV
jgi:hypothetical protein